MSFDIPDELLNELSKAFVEDAAVRALVDRGEPLRSSELSQHAFAGTRVAGELWRQMLEGSSRVVIGEDRRWDLAVRLPTAGRTVDGVIGEYLATVDTPVSVESVVQAVASAKGQHPDRLGPTVRSLLSSRDTYVEIGPDRFGLSEWFLDTSGEEEQLVVMENFLDQEPGFQELSELVEAAEIAPETPPLNVCGEVLDVACQPVSLRLLSFFCWKANPNTFDAREVLLSLQAADDLLPLFPGRWCGKTLANRLKSVVLQQSREAARSARPAVGNVADLDSLLAAKVPESAVVTFDEQEISNIIQLARETASPVSLINTLAEVFATYPTDASFVPAAQAFAARFSGDGQFQPVGPGVWMLGEQIPADATTVPESLEPVTVETQTIDGELIDALLEDPGLEADLQNQVRDPYWEDFGEEDEIIRVPQNKQTGDTLRYTVLCHHRAAGTMKVRKMDEGFFPAMPRVQRLVIVDQQSGEHVAWLNHETGLISGLKALFQARLQVSGSSFTLSKTEDAGVYEFALEAAPDPEAYVGPDRLAELRQFADVESRRVEKRTLFDILMDLFILTPKGFDFFTLWAELNVIRRTSKRLVASTLSSYPCFYARKSKSLPWTFDDRKADQGRLRVVKKHMRK